MDLLSGIMERYLKENGKMVLKMVMAFGDHLKEITTKEIGYSTGNMEKEYLNIKSVLTEDSLHSF